MLVVGTRGTPKIALLPVGHGLLSAAFTACVSRCCVLGTNSYRMAAVSAAPQWSTYAPNPKSQTLVCRPCLEYAHACRSLLYIYTYTHILHVYLSLYIYIHTYTEIIFNKYTFIHIYIYIYLICAYIYCRCLCEISCQELLARRRSSHAHGREGVGRNL